MVEGSGLGRFGTPAAKFSHSSRRKKVRGERQRNPSRTSDNTKVTESEEIANCGHRKARCSRGATCAFKHDDQSRGNVKSQTSDSGRQVRRKGITRQAQGPAESEGRPLCYSHKKKGCLTHTTSATIGIFHCASFTQGGQRRSGTNCLFVHIGKGDHSAESHTSGKITQKAFEHDREKQIRRELSTGPRHGENSRGSTSDLRQIFEVLHC